MAQNSGVVVPSSLADLMAQRGRIWAEHDHANQVQAQLEQLAAKVAAGEPTAALGALSSSAEPPDEVAAAVQSLCREIDTVNRLRTELEAAEKSRFIAIAMTVVGVIVAIVVAVVLIRR